MDKNFNVVELALIGTSLNAKIRELENSINTLKKDETPFIDLINEYENQMVDVKKIQQKILEMQK